MADAPFEEKLNQDVAKMEAKPGGVQMIDVQL